MIIELNNLLTQTVRIVRSVPMSGDRHPVEGVTYARPVDLDVTITGGEQQLSLAGRFATHLMCACDRCLDLYEVELDETIETVFIPRSRMAKEVEVELEKKELNVASYVDSIDIGQVIDEQVILALPMKRLCRDECAGLCSRCGKNLNYGPCGCTDDRVDDRLLVLQDIKERLLKRQQES